ncbi:MAG: PLP-dependent cysteine synthase family protein [Bacillota bacterium]
MELVWGPTYEEMLHPGSRGREGLSGITWKKPGGEPFYIVLPKELTGVDANIVALYGRDMPSGSHKVGATYSVTVEAQLSGQALPGRTALVFPSTGNYGIGGAWVGPRMGYDTVVVLPELMSKERFDLIESYGARFVKTPGCESSVKEIFDKCREMAKDSNTRVLNQFEAWANYRWHYYVTGNTIAELLESLKSKGIGKGRCSAFVSAMGSGGTIAAGDRLKQVFPETKVVGLEPIQCPTLYANGYGDHDIQGIGDKHVTWIHNVLNMDALMCVDDMECKLMLQVLSEHAGIDYLVGQLGIREEKARDMSTMFGISGVCNVIGAIKAAKYYRMGPEDTIVTVLTDGIDRYHSVMSQITDGFGALTSEMARERHHAIFLGARTDYIQEGTVDNRDRWFNLKYFTWVEQQGKTVQELNAQKSPGWWKEQQDMAVEIDKELIKVRRGT